jgi:hypothetical protein
MIKRRENSVRQIFYVHEVRNCCARAIFDCLRCRLRSKILSCDFARPPLPRWFAADCDGRHLNWKSLVDAVEFLEKKPLLSSETPAAGSFGRARTEVAASRRTKSTPNAKFALAIPLLAGQ